MNGFRFLAALSAASLLLALPVAAPAQDPHPESPAPQPLKPGQSAGVHAAQQTHTGLALIGKAVGHKWEQWKHHLDYVDYAVVVIVVLLVAWFLVRWIRNRRTPTAAG